jgi:hypothetical protein
MREILKLNHNEVMWTNEVHETEEGMIVKLADFMLQSEIPLQSVSIVIHIYHRLS